MRIVLISTYELGHQPFGLASPQAWLAREGHEVVCLDLGLEKFREEPVANADAVAFYLPMHTATRLALPVIERVKSLNPAARLACYGLYAPINEDLLRGLGVEAIAGGEFESSLVKWARGEAHQTIALERQAFPTPDRRGLPVLASYSKLRQNGSSKAVAYTEASRGCKHLCRHCPVVPVYQGKFRVVERSTVMDDIRQQMAAGAQHVTFGDPDFFNGPTHAMQLVDALHSEFPSVTYDATIKIEHLRKHRDLLPRLKQTGCLFVTSAVESVDDAALAKLDKGHTRQDFIEVAGWMREAGLILQPTFVAFTPWTTLENYRELLRVIASLDMVDHVSPIQLALRLLITAGSRLLELDEIRGMIGEFDAQALIYPWKHPDPAVDALADRIFQLVGREQKQKSERREIFASIWEAVGNGPLPDDFFSARREPIPYMDEAWYCCAEPIPV